MLNYDACGVAKIHGIKKGKHYEIKTKEQYIESE